LRQQNSKRARN